MNGHSEPAPDGAWTVGELDRLGQAVELEIAPRRDDGELRPYVTIWTVRAGDDIFVRAAFGPNTGWYRHATATGLGRIRAGGVERDVRFQRSDPNVAESVTAAYHAKYDRFGAGDVDPVVSPQSEELSLRIVPV